MATRRRRGEDSITFDHRGPCRDPDRHRHCPGRWRGEIALGYNADGSRKRKRVTGTTKTIVQDRLKELHADLDAGVKSQAGYTVRKALDDWLAEGLDGRSAKTIRRNRSLFYSRGAEGQEDLRPEFTALARRKLREVTASQVQHALAAYAASRSTATVSLAHNCLKRAIRQAEARDLVRRNVAELASTPAGKGKGRPSRSLTLVQATALMAVAEDTTMNAYTVIALTTGIRTEEARELRWDHVDLTGDPDADPPVPPHVAVWRSVRAGGDTKTPKSRRTLRLPEIAVHALFAHRARQSGERIAAGDRWHDTGLVFTSKVGTALDSANVKRDFRAACKTAGIGQDWTPRELRHTFVSLMSDSGMAVEEIARLAGHSSSRTTEVVYRHELRPVITTGAEVMDQLFKAR